MTGEIDIPTIYTVLYQIGGAQEDVDRVFEIDRVFKGIAQRQKPKGPGKHVK